MTARVDGSASGEFIAWCEECHEGYSASVGKACRWADAHNLANHQEAS